MEIHTGKRFWFRTLNLLAVLIVKDQSFGNIAKLMLLGTNWGHEYHMRLL